MVGVLTHSEAELQHMHGSFLLQEVHEAKEEVLLLPDLLQLQLQHLHDRRKTVKFSSIQEMFQKYWIKAGREINTGKTIRDQSVWSEWGEELTDGFLLLTSAYFCKNGTRADGGSVAGSGWRYTTDSKRHQDMEAGTHLFCLWMSTIWTFCWLILM